MLLLALPVLAQKKDLDQGKKYEIRKITVSGVQSYNPQTVVAFTGLRVKDKIFIPGERISGVIKKLWDQNLFSDINFFVTAIEGDLIDLEINITELPTLNNVNVIGIKKRKEKELISDNKLKKGTKITKNLIATTKSYITKKYRASGFLNTQVIISTPTVKDTTDSKKNLRNMNIDINTGPRVKIDEINFIGTSQLSKAKLQKVMKNTKQKKIYRFWKRSKFIPSDFEDDKLAIIKKYKEKGYRDARIIQDTIITNEGQNISINLSIEEGNKYYFGDIRFIGNSVYTNRQLQRTLGIDKGDTYNGVLLEERIADNSSPDANDLTNLYQNNGYLFSNINPVEVNAQNDTIDFEIRINEGKLVHFNHITVVGNDKTNDHVIYREIRTKPGQIYSKSAVVRTIRELGQSGYFDPEQLEPDFLNPDPNNGTIDVQYKLVEKGASQIELQGGFGGTGFVGTVGLSFNNFSIGNIFKKEAWKPLPMGDGQTLSLRAQASSFFQTYSLSFIEPWLGGKKPKQLSVSFSNSIQFLFDNRTGQADKSRKFAITGASIGMAKRLRWPDDFFTLSHAISFQHFNLKNFNTGLFTFGNGTSNNLSYTIALSRNDEFTNPIYPLGGSEFSLSAKFSLPYSAFNNVDYKGLAEERETLDLNNTDDRDRIAEIDQERFKWLEFYKIKFKGEWYTRIFGKLVLKTQTEFAFLGAYNKHRGVIPFERFFIGGDGLGRNNLDGREIVQLRGYPNQSLSGQDGGTVYDKFSLELRHPITLAQLASIYVLGFAEAGASYDGFKNFNPFDVKRSAGIGLRIFMPAFGLLGLDFAYGFDPVPGTIGPNGWETHFIIGQRF